MAASIRDLRNLAVPLYLPAFVAPIAQSIVVAILPIYTFALGAEASTVGAIVSMQGLGSPMSGIPAGLLIDQLGDRCGMLIGAGLRLLGYTICTALAYSSAPLLDEVASGEFVAGNEWAIFMLAVARFITGLGLGTFQVARSGWVKGRVPSSLRGRANSLIGGCTRIGNVVGPALGGVAAMGGGTDAGAGPAFLLQSVLGAAILALLFAVVPDSRPRKATRATADPDGASSAISAEAGTHELAIVRDQDSEVNQTPSDEASNGAGGEHGCGIASGVTQLELTPRGSLRAAPLTRRSERRCPPWVRTLFAVGAIGFSFALIRAARNFLIPLKAVAAGLDVSGAGYMMAASFVFDSAAFPAAGLLMDSRYGRKSAGVPALICMGAGLALLAVAESVSVLSIGSAVLGVGNGLSSGFVMTIGQDAAPSEGGKGAFIGFFKVLTDSALFFGPLIAGVVTDAASLDAACWAMSGWAFMSAAWYALVHREQRSDGSPGAERITATTARHTRRHTRLKEEEGLAEQVGR